MYNRRMFAQAFVSLLPQTWPFTNIIHQTMELQIMTISKTVTKAPPFGCCHAVERLQLEFVETCKEAMERVEQLPFLH
jgi:hypothetical protein